MRVLLIGPYPPPYGGMSVQIEQWHQLLTHEYGHECEVLNIGESRRKSIDGTIPVFGYFDFLRSLYKYVKRGYILHLVTNGHGLKSWISALMCALAGVLNKKRTVLVFGSGFAPEYIEHANLICRMIIRRTVVLAGRIICRNEPMRIALLSKGADPHKVVILAGSLGIRSYSESKCPSALEGFVDSHGPIVGITVSVPESGMVHPEYGLELAIKAVKQLRSVYPNLGMIVIGAHASGMSQIGELQDIERHIVFTGPLPHGVVVAVMRKLTIFLRPTCTDGDSNSVREAMALAVPVVASNTDFRPEGVITFIKGDVYDLVTKLRDTIDHLKQAKVNAQGFTGTGVAEKLLNIYEDLLRNPHVECMLTKQKYHDEARPS